MKGLRIEYDIIARFPCNSIGVRVGVASNKRGNASLRRARQLAARFAKLNNVEAHARLRLVDNGRR